MIAWWVLNERNTRKSTMLIQKQIPLCDNLLQIKMPETPLTEILGDFRSYRPGNHREFLEWVRDRAQDVGIRGYAMMDRKSAGKWEVDTQWFSVSKPSLQCCISML